MADGTEGPKGSQRVEQYVPGEVCLVVEATTPLADGDPDRREKDLYDAVQQHFNGMIADLLERISSLPLGEFLQDDPRRDDLRRDDLRRDDLRRDDLRRDMKLDVLRSRLEKTSDLLHVRDLPSHSTREADSSDAVVPRPWVRLGGANGSLPTLLCFYRIAPSDDDSDEDRRIKDDIAIVRGVVNVVNLERAGDKDSAFLARANWKITAATPNWLMAGAPADVPTGGPGSRPEPVPTPRDGKTPESRPWRVKFCNEKLEDVRKDHQGKDVVVAVLDTCPPVERVEKAAAPADRRANWLMREVFASVEIGKWPSVDASYFDQPPPRPRLKAHTVNWRKERDEHEHEHGIPIDEADLAKYDISDHGLFAAGLIKDIAPQAEIHLIRVLGDGGVGDMQALTAVLSLLPEVFLEGNDKRLIISMSLMCDIPPGVSMPLGSSRRDVPPSKEFLDYWFPHVSRTLGEDGLRRLLDNAASAMIKQSLPLLHQSLHDAMQWPEEYRDRILAVAAAGNDALEDMTRVGLPSTRLPARYDDVLGVAALNREFRPAHYTNRGDEHEIGDGVATYGGNVLREYPPEIPPAREPYRPHLIDAYKPGSSGWKPKGHGEVDAVVGIFSAPEVPLDLGSVFDADRSNCTGWAYWSGTSFATPIVSGVAACLWSASLAVPIPDGRGVIDAVKGFCNGHDGAVDCPKLEARQTPPS